MSDAANMEEVVDADSGNLPAVLATPSSEQPSPILDVLLDVTVVLGYAKLTFRSLGDLHVDSTIDLDRTTKSMVDILVNGMLFARGDLVVIDDDQVGVRVQEIVGGADSRHRDGR